MKTPDDLAEDEFIEFTHCYYADGTLGKFEIRLISRLTGNLRFPNGKAVNDHRGNLTQIFLLPGPKAWVVDSVDASEAGWGPLLYDVAMELANEQGCGLRSHETNVTDYARKIWEFYFSKRGDVSRKGVPRASKRPRKAGPLRYMYFKTPPNFVSRLKALGKWVETKRQITDWG